MFVGESVEVAICIDTSGSIGGDELGAFMGEIQGIFDAYPQIRGRSFSPMQRCTARMNSAKMPQCQKPGAAVAPPLSRSLIGWHSRNAEAPNPCAFTSPTGMARFQKRRRESPVLWGGGARGAGIQKLSVWRSGANGKQPSRGRSLLHVEDVDSCLK
jgi:predicted metal-dependent peptidase